jgi:hypothetical protein
VVPVSLVVPGGGRAARAKARVKGLDGVPVGRPNRAVRTDPVPLLGRVVRRRDRHPRRSPRTVHTTAVTTSSAGHAMHLAASARPTTEHRRRRAPEDTAGTTDRHPADRRQTGTDHHLPVAGTVLPLPVAGITGTTAQPATSAQHETTSVGSTTPASPRSRCSIRRSAAGDSGTSVTGFRCTDATQLVPASGLLCGFGAGHRLTGQRCCLRAR